MNSVQAHFSKSSSSQLITGPPHASTKQLPVLPSFPLPQQQQPQPFIPQRQPVIAISPYNNQVGKICIYDNNNLPKCRWRTL
jgi:hypothetical protein